MSSTRILVVDDDRSQCLITSKFLSEAGYQVDTAEEGLSALQLVERTPYSLAVLDYQMPHMDGVELFRRITQLQPDVLGIFLTSFTTLDTVYPAIMSGIERVLAKPVARDELVALVESLIGVPGYRSTNEV